MKNPLELYHSLISSGTNPALIWYGDYARIELSGKVCANHIAKIANFLSEECEVVPTTRVLLDLPAHWKSVMWTLSALICGAEVIFFSEYDEQERRKALSETGRDDVVITSDPHRAAKYYDGDFLVALTLSDLALSWDGDELPAQVYDGAAEVLGYADALLVDADSSESNYRELLCNSGDRQGLQREGVFPDDASHRAIVVPHPSAVDAFFASYSCFSRSITLVTVARKDADVQTIASEEKAQILNF